MWIFRGVWMARWYAALVALVLLLAPAPALAAPGSLSRHLVWMPAGDGIFSVDTSARTVRYRSCAVDTGRVYNPGMRVAGGFAVGRISYEGTSYRFRVPLAGRSTGTLEVGGRVLTGPTVTSPQPPASPALGRRLRPLVPRLQAIVDAAPVTAGVSVRDLSGRFGEQQVSVAGRFRPKAASVIKLWVLVELMRRIDCGQAAYTDTVLVLPSDVVGGTGELQHEDFPQDVTLFRLAQYMIKYSDNTATNVLIDYLGGFAPVNALIDSMNQRETVLARKMLATPPPENFTSPDDVISLLGAVWSGDVLGRVNRDLMLSFMLEQTLNSKIPAALPSGVPVAHKTGELADVSHDVGYYLIPGTEIAVAFLTAGPEPLGAATVRELARAVYDYIEQPAPPVGGLPITGSPASVPLAGALLVLVGGLLVVAFRRRGRRPIVPALRSAASQARRARGSASRTRPAARSVACRRRRPDPARAPRQAATATATARRWSRRY
ncbi:serine hydrolase [Asanoa sp. NPDC050611]|uniref:serine hydrolase n=1 Tax=Asanoa sp. NPDC050611 TaxID=3157098 RepID=UPI0033F71AAD